MRIDRGVEITIGMIFMVEVPVVAIVGVDWMILIVVVVVVVTALDTRIIALAAVPRVEVAVLLEAETGPESILEAEIAAEALVETAGRIVRIETVEIVIEAAETGMELLGEGGATGAEVPADAFRIVMRTRNTALAPPH
jgi:hypothetical protein